MALFVYITEECKNDMSGEQKQINNFAKRIETDQRTTLFDNFPPPYLKKRFGNKRLLASEKYVKDHTVVCFHRLLPRGGKDYEAFLNDPQAYGEQYFMLQVANNDLTNWVEQKLSGGDIPTKQSPSTQEQEYLFSITGQQNVRDEVFICETAEWVESVTETKLEPRLLFIYEIIVEAIDDIQGPRQNHNLNKGDMIYLADQGRGLSILCRYFPDHKKLLLVKPFYQITSQEKQKIEEQYNQLLTFAQKDITDKKILQYSRRSYPNDILLDEDFWLEVENDQEANLALSSEETELLQSVHDQQSGAQARGFPLFINGRAGSGKSTILLYLFADYLRYYLRNENNDLRPLYLTRSHDLLKRSRDTSYRLIQCNYKALDEDLDLTRGIDDSSFKEFQSFLHNLVPLDDRDQRFKLNTFIDYGRFKKLWDEKFGYTRQARERYGPDHSWHVIRSYIKGLSVDGYLAKEEYDEQPKSERTVTKEKFEEIYDIVWDNWYKDMTNEKYWDDQDLVRYLLEKNLIQPSYPAIFCDEAQDFTRIELEVLLRLSIFSDRKLASHEINRVPFAFAGDPFQTLNPTGFRWAAIKVAYVLKFIRALDTTSGTNPVLNYKELCFNYRSASNIVRLCNTIQGLRAALFGIPDIEPQDTWLHQDFSPLPVWFERGATGVMDNLKEQTDLIIIVPCDEGSEKEFVDADEFLKEAVDRDDEDVPQNVLSPSRAKGLEFNRVVLYGFGENAPDGLLDHLSDPDPFDQDPDSALPLEYFINRLYVAASRPKRRLFVIDSQQGLDNLWKFATDEGIKQQILQKLRDGNNIWQDHLGTLQQGNTESWNEDREDQVVVAKRYEQEGLAKKDPYLMRQAALAYRNSQAQKETECFAYALLFEGKYEDSGTKFISCENGEKALDAFWEGRQFKRISDLGNLFPSVRNGLEFLMAEFLNTQDIQLEAYIQLLQEIKNHLTHQDQSLIRINDESWRHAFQRSIDKVIKGCQGDVRDWGLVVSLNTFLCENGVEIEEKSLADIKYRSKDYEGAIKHWESAIEHWDQVENTKHDEYQEARVSVREAKALILINQMKSGDIVTDTEKHFVAEYYKLKESYMRAATIFSELKDSKDSLNEILNIVLQEEKIFQRNSDAKKILNMLLKKMVKVGELSDAVQLLTKYQCRQISRENQPKLASILKVELNKWNAMLTKLIASSNILSQSPNQTKTDVQDFLRNKYINQPIDSWMDFIPVDIVGSAIERADRYVDGLVFYEQVENSNCSEAYKRQASIRWAVCKSKQIKHANPQDWPVLKYENELQNKLREIGLKQSDLDKEPDFPIVKLPQPDTEPPKLSDKYNFLNFELNCGPSRINITNRDTMEMAAILLNEKKCNSIDVAFSENQGVFVSEEWGIDINLNHWDTEQYLEISSSKHGEIIKIPDSP